MKTGQIEILLTLISAWAVYGVCQNDVVLPVIGAVLILISFLQRINIPPAPDLNLKRKIHWVNFVGAALALGWLWRSFLPENRVDFGPIGIIQSTFVFLSFFIWFHHNYYYRSYALRGMAWIIVALSIDVKFDRLAYVAFWVFCLLNTSFIFLRSFSIAAEEKKKSKELKIKKILAPIPYFIVMLAVCFSLFVVMVQLVKLGDQAFMLYLQEYFFVLPQQLLEFGSTLDLRSPGNIGRDIRPILEIDRRRTDNFYLATQVFEHYQNGTWKKPGLPRHPVSNILDPGKKRIDLIMFDQLKGIIPAPANVSAVRSNEQIFEQDENGIITSPNANVLKASFAIGEAPSLLQISEREKMVLTELSPFLKKNLSPYVDGIVGREESPVKTAKAIENYFKNNFEYTLNVRFGADEKGILTMLKDEKPAYCSYFASAMILMLRSRNIPARLKGGFLASEVINTNKQFLVRIRDAHAWVEALLPVEGKPNLYQRVDFDPTPGISRLAALNMDRPLNPWLDWLWRSQRRVRAELMSLDSTKLSIRLLLAALIFIFIKNLKKVLQGLKTLNVFPGSEKTSDPQDLASCRHLYQSFEKILQKTFDLHRGETQTNAELMIELREKKVLSLETLSFIESFLDQYHAVRFGKRRDDNLGDYLKAIEMKLAGGRGKGK